jgi:hypothetical protein
MKRLAETRAWIAEHATAERWVRCPYCATKMTVTRNGREYYGTGFSKCRPGDEWSIEKGLAISDGRAALDIARQIENIGRWLPLSHAMRTWKDTTVNLGHTLGKVMEGIMGEKEARQHLDNVLGPIERQVELRVEAAQQPAIAYVDEFPPREKEEER